jgi:hypothetical protein
VAALSELLPKHRGGRPQDIAHIGDPERPGRGLCGASVIGVKAPADCGHCVVCSDLWRRRERDR